MNEPKRILDSEESLSRALLASAEDDRPPPGSRAKAMAALGIGAAVATTASTAAGAKLVAWKWIVGLALVPVAASTAYVATRTETKSEPTIAPPTVSVAAPKSSVVPAAIAPSEPVVVPPVVSTAPPKVAAPVVKPPSTQVADEAALIDAAARALKSGDKKTALAKLDEYDRRFKGGVLEGSARDLRAKAAKLP
jgi:hypothetical protein